MRALIAVNVVVLAASACAEASGPGSPLPEEPPILGTAHPPPPDPNAPLASGTQPRTFAISSIDFGDADNECLLPGYDLDGIGTKFCHDGTDNLFALWFVAVLDGIAPPPYRSTSQVTSDAIAGGETTALIEFENLGNAPSQNEVVAHLYMGADLGRPPAWDGTDEWPVAFDSVSDSKLDAPKVTFEHGYVVDGTWVSGPSSQPFGIVIRGNWYSLLLPIATGFMTVELDLASKEIKSDRATLAGILDAAKLKERLKHASTRADGCDWLVGWNGRFLLDTFWPDIELDGAPCATPPCDGVSIGFAFQVRPVKLGEVAPAMKTTLKPTCP